MGGGLDAHRGEAGIREGVLEACGALLRGRVLLVGLGAVTLTVAAPVLIFPDSIAAARYLIYS